MQEDSLGNIFKRAPMWYRRAVLILLGLILTGITGIFWKGKTWLDDKDQRSFTSANKRLKTEEFIDKIYNPSTNQYRYFQHITEPGIHMSREAKDSIYVTRRELQELIKNTALNYYDVMRQQSAHEREQDEINKDISRKMDLILTKLDQMGG